MSNGKPNDHAAAAEALDLSGRTIGDFRVLRRLGQGGMGQVYLAEQLSLKRNVALKILRPELAASPTALARFEAEAKAVARITHANIRQVYDFKVEDGLAYMALEYVEGRNLNEYLVRKGPPELLVAVSIMRQVAAALQRASEVGIIHRDIKPENILLTRKGEVKVADFGLVRCLEGEKPAVNLTQSGVTMGTPLYMSPEQVEGKPVDPRTDIYSFGVTCYHMLAGQPPFRGESAIEVALQHVQNEPVPLAKVRPDLPEPLCAIVRKMMAKNPDNRYQTGKELLREINRLKESLSGVVSNTTLGPPPLPDPPTVTTPAAAEETVRIEVPLGAPVWALALLLGGAVLASLFVAVGGGVLLARAQRHGQGLLPHGKDIPAADAGVLDGITLPSKQEQTLRDAAEQYLNPPKSKSAAELAGGIGVCMDLGLFYLDAQRPDDADRLFTRLEAIKEPRSYRTVGQVGRGVTLALQDRAKESNGYFRDVFGPLQPPGKVFKEKGLGAALKRLEAQLPQPQLIASMFDNPRWRYWIARARWYNSKNGVPEDEVSFYLRHKSSLRDGGAEALRPGPGKPPDKDRGPPKKDKEP